MSQQFSKLQANAPPKPPDVATGLMPARVQHGLELGSRTPHSSRGAEEDGTWDPVGSGWEGLQSRPMLTSVCEFQVAESKKQACKLKHSVLFLQLAFFKAGFLLVSSPVLYLKLELSELRL